MMKDLGTDFYLTGGTALSRGYFNHRFSDDLDFFMNANTDYLSQVKRFLKKINHSEAYRLNRELNYQINDDFSRFFLELNRENNDVILKVDFVNDIEVYYGDIVFDERFGKMDNVENILINKITALTRFEPKDIADIWIISRHHTFNWNDILFKAKCKDAGITEEEASGIIKNFPSDLLEKIRWNIPIDKSVFFEEVSIIAKELLKGTDNSLFKKNA